MLLVRDHCPLPPRLIDGPRARGTRSIVGSKGGGAGCCCCGAHGPRDHAVLTSAASGIMHGCDHVSLRTRSSMAKLAWARIEAVEHILPHILAFVVAEVEASTPPQLNSRRPSLTHGKTVGDNCTGASERDHAHVQCALNSDRYALWLARTAAVSRAFRVAAQTDSLWKAICNWSGDSLLTVLFRARPNAMTWRQLYVQRVVAAETCRGVVYNQQNKHRYAETAAGVIASRVITTPQHQPTAADYLVGIRVCQELSYNSRTAFLPGRFPGIERYTGLVELKAEGVDPPALGPYETGALRSTSEGQLLYLFGAEHGVNNCWAQQYNSGMEGDPTVDLFLIRKRDGKRYTFLLAEWNGGMEGYGVYPLSNDCFRHVQVVDDYDDDPDYVEAGPNGLWMNLYVVVYQSWHDPTMVDDSCCATADAWCDNCEAERHMDAAGLSGSIRGVTVNMLPDSDESDDGHDNPAHYILSVDELVQAVESPRHSWRWV